MNDRLEGSSLSDAVSRFGSGRAVARIEDGALLRGLGRFTDNVPAAG
jgi:aerobic carbon-monoxide dehydrogenase large subunit